MLFDLLDELEVALNTRNAAEKLKNREMIDEEEEDAIRSNITVQQGREWLLSPKIGEKLIGQKMNTIDGILLSQFFNLQEEDQIAVWNQLDFKNSWSLEELRNMVSFFEKNPF